MKKTGKDSSRDRRSNVVEQTKTGRVRTQAERSEATREKVMQAALEVLRERGYAGFRTEAVVEKAGMSRGAMLHQFPKKRDLIVSAFEFLYSQVEQSSIERGHSGSDIDSLLNAIFNDAKAFFLSEDFLAILDVVVSAANEPDIRHDILKISRERRAPVEQAWTERLSAYLPGDVAADIVFMTFNIYRGFGMRTFISDDPKTFEHMAGLWKEMLRNHLERVLPESNIPLAIKAGK